jgi:hypothetical protein
MKPRILRIHIRTCIATIPTSYSVFVGCVCDRHNQTPMPDAFGRDQIVGDLLNVAGLAAEHDHLQAVVVIQVDVQRRHNAFVVLMLKFCELFVQQPHMVVIDYGHGSHYGRIGFLRAFFQKLGTREIAKCFRSVGVSSLLHQFVEPVQQFAFNRYSEAPQIRHVSHYSCLGTNAGRKPDRAANCRRPGGNCLAYHAKR